MFLDPAGPVTIQRFEEVKYNKLVKFEQEARGFFWIPEEVSLTKDANDFKEASDTVKHIFTSNLVASNSPGQFARTWTSTGVYSCCGHS
jgi:ribonucleotide reductase beta subunit family protein with ferritin-like domain